MNLIGIAQCCCNPLVYSPCDCSDYISDLYFAPQKITYTFSDDFNLLSFHKAGGDSYSTRRFKPCLEGKSVTLSLVYSGRNENINVCSAYWEAYLGCAYGFDFYVKVSVAFGPCSAGEFFYYGCSAAMYTKYNCTGELYGYMDQWEWDSKALGYPQMSISKALSLLDITIGDSGDVPGVWCNGYGDASVMHHIVKSMGYAGSNFSAWWPATFPCCPDTLALELEAEVVMQDADFAPTDAYNHTYFCVNAPLSQLSGTHTFYYTSSSPLGTGFHWATDWIPITINETTFYAKFRIPAGSGSLGELVISGTWGDQFAIARYQISGALATCAGNIGTVYVRAAYECEDSISESEPGFPWSGSWVPIDPIGTITVTSLDYCTIWGDYECAECPSGSSSSIESNPPSIPSEESSIPSEESSQESSMVSSAPSSIASSQESSIVSEESSEESSIESSIESSVESSIVSEESSIVSSVESSEESSIESSVPSEVSSIVSSAPSSFVSSLSSESSEPSYESSVPSSIPSESFFPSVPSESSVVSSASEDSQESSSALSSGVSIPSSITSSLISSAPSGSSGNVPSESSESWVPGDACVECTSGTTPSILVVHVEIDLTGWGGPNINGNYYLEQYESNPCFWLIAVDDTYSVWVLIDENINFQFHYPSIGFLDTCYIEWSIDNCKLQLPGKNCTGGYGTYWEIISAI